MGRAVKFHGCNFMFKAPEGSENVDDLHCFTNGTANVLAVELTDAELAEVNRTKRVYVSVLSGNTFYPIRVGSESDIRELAYHNGGAWETKQDKADKELIRIIHTQLGQDRKRFELVKKDPIIRATFAKEVDQLNFSREPLKNVYDILDKYLESMG